MSPLRPLLCMLLASTLPVLAQAELVVREGDAVEPKQERFFPITNARRGTVAAPRVVKPGRSDSAAMADGFFRIDRSHPAPMKAHAPLVIRVPQEGESASASTTPRVIYGGAALQQQQQEQPAAQSFALPAFKSLPTQISSHTSAADSGSILSLFSGESATQHGSFRDALRASGVDSSTPVTGKHQWPVPVDYKQRLSSQYGFRNDPMKGDPKFHGGIDIASPIGTPVLASADGVVIGTGSEGGYGQTITIQHNDGSESRYSHLSSQLVKQGQAVKSGQTIGAVGSSGHSTGPHLDYRLTKEGVSVNPFEAIQSATNSAGATKASTIAQPVVPVVPRPTRTARNERIIVVQ